jgi:hypothetical protein
MLNFKRIRIIRDGHGWIEKLLSLFDNLLNLLLSGFLFGTL